MMNEEFRKAMEAKGYVFGDAEDFLELNQKEREMVREKLEESRIKIKTHSGYPGACPAQWECISEDRTEVYIRYRAGTLRVYAPFPDVILMKKEIGDPRCGYMKTEDMKEWTSSVLDWSNAAVDDPGGHE